jgi:hypothetical protein
MPRTLTQFWICNPSLPAAFTLKIDFITTNITPTMIMAFTHFLLPVLQALHLSIVCRFLPCPTYSCLLAAACEVMPITTDLVLVPTRTIIKLPETAFPTPTSSSAPLFDRYLPSPLNDVLLVSTVMLITCAFFLAALGFFTLIRIERQSEQIWRLKLQVVLLCDEKERILAASSPSSSASSPPPSHSDGSAVDNASENELLFPGVPAAPVSPPVRFSTTPSYDFGGTLPPARKIKPLRKSRRTVGLTLRTSTAGPSTESDGPGTYRLAGAGLVEPSMSPYESVTAV